MNTAEGLALAGSALLAATGSDDPWLTRFRELGADGRLHIQRCDGCGYLRFPPAAVCPECLSTEATWIVDSGAGSVWSFCVYHRAFSPHFKPLVPYLVALVELDSGPRMITDVVGVPDDDVVVGMRGVLQPTAAGSLVYFHPHSPIDGTHTDDD